MSAATSILIGSGPGLLDLPIVGVTDPSFLARVGSQVTGIPSATLAQLVGSIIGPSLLASIDVVTPVTGPTFNWTTERNLGVTASDAAVEITLPDASNVTDWLVGETRSVAKFNVVNAQTCTLITGATVVLNGAAAGTDGAVEGFSSPPTENTKAAQAFIHRLSATAYWMY